MRGRLVTVEGLDGAGKTTLVAALVPALRARGTEVEALREPGGVVLAERLRALVKDPGVRVGGRAEALVFAAARAQLVEERVLPLLEAGRWVLLDRYVDSSLAYQGAGRGLGVQAVRALNAFGVGDLRPDRTLLLRVAPEVGRGRLAGRAEAPDRLEAQDEAFFARVADAYEALARAEPERVRVLDAGGRPEEVLRGALDALEGLVAPAA